MFNNGGKPAASEKVGFETGARKLKANFTSDANDEFSQDAAANKKPTSGIGLTESNAERSDTDKSDLVDSDTAKVLKVPDGMPQAHEDKNRRL